MALSGFDRFDSRVIFVKVEADQSVRNFVIKLRKNIKEIPGMPTEEFPDWHPHATLANKLTAQEINKIWDYALTLEKPNFSLQFDNVTIFRYGAEQNWFNC